MSVSLTLLDGVRWRDEPVVGDRPQALLAALAADGGRAVRAERLIDLVWGDDALANGAKALQVLVSRVRATCGPDAVVRDGDGYRLGLPAEEVDSRRLADRAAEAARAIDGDAAAAAELAREALTLAAGLAPVADREAGPLADLRRGAARDAAAARAVHARACSRTGSHAEALPALEAAHGADPADESLLADLLRSEAAVRGTGAALERFERHRVDLRERLGASPGEDLQRVHRDLLARDSPVREGVRHDATALLGRDEDIRRLRALVASSRVVSIVGAGGLGKTRLAHVLGRDAAQPIVHFVELVGVTASEDLVGEVGSALGVRDSVTGRRVLTPAQRADVRARIAQHLGRAPSLLILDNCEHIVDAVAELVAFLVVTVADLRVVTTTRAPLAIGAERVYPLGELGVVDAVELFRQRAVAARPGVQLDNDLVAGIVARLDGLPLAIELAAANVRAMSVQDIDRRLENRFALLRGGDRSAPDRHQTLLAVIDWSWNLLAEPERRALRRLSVFHDGFTLAAAEAVVGDGALDAVQGLADQSLLQLRESTDGVRYRILETVREFGRMQLVDAGEDAEARAAQRTWATALAGRELERMFGPEQFEAIDALGAEEANLADILRQSLAEHDVATAVQIVAGLGTFWSMRGEHGRILAMIEAIADVVRDWHPPRRLETAARAAMVIMLVHAMIIADERGAPMTDLLRRIGEGNRRTVGEARVAAMTRIALAYDPADPAAFVPRLEELAAGRDRDIAMVALQWASYVRENRGDFAGAAQAAERALGLLPEGDGPWTAAMLHTQLAELTTQLGDRAAATVHARAALPVLERLRAFDDELQLRALLVHCAVADGRLDEAEAELAHLARIADAEPLFVRLPSVLTGEAEVALARGDRAGGLATYARAAQRMRSMRMPGLPPTGHEPWTVFGDAAALTAFAHHGSGADEDAVAAELLAACGAHLRAILQPDNPYLDYPVAGLALFAVGSWGLLRDAVPPREAAALLVLAERFGYNRTAPTTAWQRIEPHAERLAPGALDELRAGHGERRGPELLDEARGLVEQLVS